MIEVYKYGGNLLKYKGNRKYIYEYLKDEISKGNKIFMVVSAFGRNNECLSTDYLSSNIELLDSKEKDRLITFGEIYSSLIIKNEMLREKINVTSVDYNEIGIVCDNSYQNGNVENIDMSYLNGMIDKYDVVIVPGFIGESMEGNIISLGRNTSDLTAIILGDYFKVNKVNIIKEVNGVYKEDIGNKKNDRIIDNISYDEMLSLIKAGSNMFNEKSIKYAKDNNVVVEVRGIDKDKGTIISDIESNEEILFVNREENEIKIVFKDMDVFNNIFKSLVEERIRFDDLFIVKNVAYIRGNEDKIKNIVNKYL